MSGHLIRIYQPFSFPLLKLIYMSAQHMQWFAVTNLFGLTAELLDWGCQVTLPAPLESNPDEQVSPLTFVQIFQTF